MNMRLTVKNAVKRDPGYRFVCRLSKRMSHLQSYAHKTFYDKRWMCLV